MKINEKENISNDSKKEKLNNEIFIEEQQSKKYKSKNKDLSENL